MKYTLLILLAFALPCQSNARADGQIFIDVGQAKVKKSLLALPSIQYEGTQPGNGQHIHVGFELYAVIANDLAVSNLFTMVSPDAYLEDPNKVGLKPYPTESNGFKFENWKSIGADFLIRAGYHVTGDEITLDTYLYYVPQGKLVFGKSYKAPSSQYRKMAHTFCNDVMKALTGKSGMFISRLVASREDPVVGRENFKEIYMLDWDGANMSPITQSRTISISPNWSNASDKIAYTSFAYHTVSKMRNSDLFIYDLNDGKRYLVSYRKGVNSGAVFLPGDKEILLTLTKDGNPDIYRLALDGSSLTQLTHGPNHALNVEPAISPDGRKIAFSSDRSGQPMIYTMNMDGTGVKRLTFAGVYNSTPAWSPDGKTLAMAIFDSSHFDIFTIGIDGTGLKRLTAARKTNGRPANNESPSWSPDGTHIVFVSDRVDGKQIYIINSDGTNERRITHDHALWDRPKWSHALN